MHVLLELFGSMWVRVSCTGIYVHTAFCVGREEMNSIRRMHELMGAVMQWIAEWEKKAAYGGKKRNMKFFFIFRGPARRARPPPAKNDFFLPGRLPPTNSTSAARPEN